MNFLWRAKQPWNTLSNPKQLSCKKWAAPRRPRNGYDGRFRAKILTMTIQVNLCCLFHTSLGFDTKFTWIVVFKIFINLQYHHSHFLAATVDFASIFTMAFLGTAHFFYSWVFWIRFHLFFCNCMLQCWHISINGCCYLSSCFLYSCSTLHMYYTYFYLNLYICYCTCQWLQVN